MKSVQKTILLRLENIEQLVQGRDTEKQTGHAHTHEDSWHHLDDGFDDSEYWQSHVYYSSSYPPSPYAQSTQPQYIPQLTSSLVDTQPQYVPPLIPRPNLHVPLLV